MTETDPVNALYARRRDLSDRLAAASGRDASS
jgi:hypothetical protein